MKNILLFAVLIIVSTGAFAQTKAGKGDTAEHTVLYSCPMHPNQKMDKPGNCPICGMTLTLSSKEQLKTEVTKTYTCGVHPEVVSNKPGKCSKCGSKLVVDRKGTKQASTVYTCGMHPDVVSDKAGKCTICGMALIEKTGKEKGNN